MLFDALIMHSCPTELYGVYIISCVYLAVQGIESFTTIEDNIVAPLLSWSDADQGNNEQKI